MKMVDDLQDEIISVTGLKHVYINAPSKLTYPCVVIETEPGKQLKANNRLYLYTSHYTLTFITKDPESDLGMKMLKHFMSIEESAQFISDGLAHFVYDIYY